MSPPSPGPARERCDVLVVGGGPTGLGAAWRLARRRHPDWILCEAEAELGGLASSVLDEHGFTWDLGGHVHFSHYAYYDDLMDELLGRDGWLEHGRSAWVWMAGRFVPYPLQLNLRSLPPAEAASCLLGLLRRPRRPSGAGAPPGFEEWLRLGFGDGLTELFLRPYNEKVWAHPLDRMSSTWIGERVARVGGWEAARGLVTGAGRDWGPNSRFRFPRRGGTGAVWRAVADDIGCRAPGRLRVGRRLVRVDGARREAHLDDGSVVAYRRLISTIPIDVLVPMAGLPGLRPALVGLAFTSTHVLGVALTGREPPHLRGKSWIYFPGPESLFHRVTVFSGYSPCNVPSEGAFWSLLVEVSESGHRPVDAGTLPERVVGELIAHRLVSGRAQVHHVWRRRLERGYPVPTVTRDAALAEILVALEGIGILSRGRFGGWRYEVSNQDHCFAQGVEAVDRILDGTPERTFAPS